MSHVDFGFHKNNDNARIENALIKSILYPGVVVDLNLFKSTIIFVVDFWTKIDVKLTCGRRFYQIDDDRIEKTIQ